MACREVESWYLTTTGFQVLQDKMVRVKGQDGKCNDKLWRSTTGWFAGVRSQGPDTEPWRVGEITFDILPIHCDKSGKYHQS